MSHEARPPLVLASTSRFRQQLLARLGLPFEGVAHRFDERAADHLFGPLSPAEFALHLARGKAESLASVHPQQFILAADQLAVIDEPEGPELLHKPGTHARAVEQLMRLSGRSHRLVSGVVLRAPDGRERSVIDEQHLTMRAFERAEAQDYVARCEPLDSCGSYHIEDAGIRLFERIRSEDYTGIIGLPLLAVCQLLREVDLL